MKIAIVGGGFTGLAAALILSEKHHQVTVFEKEKNLGGLAGTFKLPDWEWQIEQHYHHWFTNDKSAINLIIKLGLADKLIFPKSQTSIYFDGKILPFNSPLQLLTFSPLPLYGRLRAGLVLLYLKILPPGIAVRLEKYRADLWLRKNFGDTAYTILWEPLLSGKFGEFASMVNMAWFWARIKKRTLKLGYLRGGYQKLIDAMATKIMKQGGKIVTGSSFDPQNTGNFDKVIITTSSYSFLQMYPALPDNYRQRLTSIPHLFALNLLLVSREKILPGTYWLNINDRKFPFIAVIAQTNMIDKKYYGGKHLTWIGNYLPQDHPYLKMTKEQLFHLYLPYIKKINPLISLQPATYNLQLFKGPFAQPVFPVNYSRFKPEFETPVKNVYLANMDMVYPWDRGTNYAIEMGQKVARFIAEQ